MEARTLIHQMAVLEQLKNATRHSWTSTGRQESVAEHSWRMTMMAYFMKDEFPEADIDKVIRMCMMHDLGECFTGDIPVFYKTEEHEVREEELLHRWLDELPEPFSSEMKALFEEMEQQQTLEARLYKAIDKLEVIIQHNEADLSTWIPLEYELNLVHGQKQVAFSEYLKSIKAVANEDTRIKLKENGITE